MTANHEHSRFMKYSLIQHNELQTLFILAIPVLYFTSVINLLCGETLTRYSVYPTLFILAWVVRLLHRNIDFHSYILTLAIFLAVTSLFFPIAQSMADFSYDSMAYHGPSIIYLANGWNPIKDWLCCPNGQLVTELKGLSESYPKSIWLTNATLYLLTGKIESAFVTNIILLVACLMAGNTFFRKVLNLPRMASLCFATLIAINPVTITQLFSLYVDGVLVSSMAAHFFLLLTSIKTGERRYMILSFSLLPLLLNTKFTAIPYVTILGFTIITYSLSRRSLLTKQIAIYSTTIGIISILGFGFNPYVTNTIIHHNPFYPAIHLDGKKRNKVDALSNQTVDSFINKNRFEKFFISIFSVPEKNNWKNPEFSIPFSTTHYIPIVGNLFGGFGPLFSGIIILSTLLLPVIKGINNWLVLSGITASIFVTAAAWWARLTPQTWWLPILIVSFSWHNKTVSIRILSIIILILLATNSAITGNAMWQYQWGKIELVKNYDFEVFEGYRVIDRRQFLYSIYRLKEFSPNLPQLDSCQHGETTIENGWDRPFLGIKFCLSPKFNDHP